MISLLGVLLVRILEGMFVVGLFGSTLVLLITFVEDALSRPHVAHVNSPPARSESR
jgi:hypothetical protein